MVSRFGHVLLVLSATAGVALPQTFDVASIKLSGPQSVRESDGGPGSSDPGKYRFGKATLLDLIVEAYKVEYFQVSSKSPLDGQIFDFVANVPEGTTKEQFRTMMQNFLAERFHLKLHIESREFAAYELVVAKSGLRIKEGCGAASTRDGFPNLPPNRPGMISQHSMSGAFEVVRMRAQQEPISLLARFLPIGADLPVVDRTGLTGKYDFTLGYSKELSSTAAGFPNDPPALPNMFTAVQEQLGLQLVRARVPFDVLAVDSVDKAPTDN